MVSPMTEGERQVPEQVWKLPHFQNWLQAQKNAGNRLDGFKSIMEFYVADGKFLFLWAAHVDIYVAAEDRNKSNEIVISRPDIKHVICIHKRPPLEYDRDNHPFRLYVAPEVILVREFRSPASTPNGFILESPGGSSFKKETALETAAEELFEETGLRIDTDRLVPIGARQLAGTLSAHKARVYAVELTQDDMEAVRSRLDEPHGNIFDSEQTWVEIHDVNDLVDRPVTDWSTLGMIFAAMKKFRMNYTDG